MIYNQAVQTDFQRSLQDLMNLKDTSASSQSDPSKSFLSVLEKALEPAKTPDEVPSQNETYTKTADSLDEPEEKKPEVSKENPDKSSKETKAKNTEISDVTVKTKFQETEAPKTASKLVKTEAVVSEADAKVKPLLSKDAVVKSEAKTSEKNDAATTLKESIALVQILNSNTVAEKPAKLETLSKENKQVSKAGNEIKQGESSIKLEKFAKSAQTANLQDSGKLLSQEKNAAKSELLQKAISTVEKLEKSVSGLESSKTLGLSKLDDKLSKASSLQTGKKTLKLPENKENFSSGKTDKKQNLERGTDARLKAERGLSVVSKRVEMTDLRGLNSAQQIRSGQIQTQDLQTKDSSLGQSKNTVQLNPDLSLNTTYVPASERVVELPVLSAQNGGFGQSLRDWLRGQGNKELAQEARILLKDQGSGEIKLILKPESLGEVRINLQLQDGSIGGTIYVENDEVRQAFQDQLADLTAAFNEGGFSQVDIQVALGNSGGGNSFKDQAYEAQDQKQNTQRAIKSLENQVSRPKAYEYGNTQIDLVV